MCEGWKYEELCMQKQHVMAFFYRCTLHLDNVKVPFYQTIHAGRNTVHTPQHETHAATTLQNL